MSDPVLAAALVGLAAGLGVAMPLGAIAVLILRESMLNGLRRGAAAALGVASVDLVYCALAVSVGAVFAPVIRSWGVAPGLISGAVLIGLGIQQLVKAGTATDPSPELPSRAVFVRFVALTAINPITLIYFLALAGGLTMTGGGPAAALSFVIAAGLASLVWQLGLAVAGRGLGAVVSERASRMLGLVASALVASLGVAVILATLVSAG